MSADPREQLDEIRHMVDVGHCRYDLEEVIFLLGRIDDLRAWLKTALAYVPEDDDGGDDLDELVREEITALLASSEVTP